MNGPAIKTVDYALSHLTRVRRALRSIPVTGDVALEEQLEQAVKSLYRARNALLEVAARGRRSCAG